MSVNVSSLVMVQAVTYHVAGKEDIMKPIVIQVTDGHTPTVVEVGIG